MLETCGQVMTFLNQAGMMKSLKAFQDDMEQYVRNQQTVTSELPSSCDDSNNTQGYHLLKIIKKVVEQNSKKESANINNANNNYWRNPQQPAQKSQKLYSQEETEQIMEKLMNKLVASPTLLEDEKLNSKIEKFFDNQTFQKMVEATDVMIDIPHMSGTDTFIGMNKQYSQSNINTEKSNSWEEGRDPNVNNQAGVKGSQKEVKQPEVKPEYTVSLPKTSANQGNSAANPTQIQLQETIEKKIIDKNNLEIKATTENKPQESSGSYPSYAGLLPQIDPLQKDGYLNDEDLGYDLYKVPDNGFAAVSQQLAINSNFPARAVSNVPKKEGYDAHKEYPIFPPTIPTNHSEDGQRQDESRIHLITQKKQIKKQTILLPDYVKFPISKDEFYPVQYDKIIFDSFSLKVIFDRERTGFEETKDFPIVINSIVAGRYQVMEYLGGAAFSKAIQCLDLVTNKVMCMKVIENNKDYFDQSIDEIKLLRYINFNGDPEEKNVLKYYDYFYYKEHLFIVTELLEENLYEFYKFNRENESERYFTVGRLQRVTKQILIALDFIHNLRLIHCDLKPENILMKSKSKCEVKVIDFGSSCFIHDPLSSYVQSRSYRAPEVIIGCKYDYRIDIWSLGCILSELWTGNVLFQNDNIQGLLARVIGIIGPFPEWMMKEGRLVNNFFTREKLLYMEGGDDRDQSQQKDNPETYKNKMKGGKIQILVPKQTNLKFRMKTEDHVFLDFVRQCLQIDYTHRPTAKEALNHPWLTRCKYPDGL